MHTKKSLLLRLFGRAQVLFGVFVLCAFFTSPANANLLDKYNLAPFVPLVLEIMMTVATSLYDFFVGNGDGIIYLLIYAFLGFHISLYLFKMHLPKDWLGFLGFSEGGEMWTGKPDVWGMSYNVLKPCVRAIIAAVFLLQVKPVYVTEWLVNPFLQFGSIYTEQILSNVSKSDSAYAELSECPESIITSKWLTKRSCDFLVKPVNIISRENNKVIKYAFGFLQRGMRGMMTIIPHGGKDLMNVITGIILLFVFISANVFMALLIIQAIFDFCLSLIMYPFNVLGWVAKKSDKWFDIWPAFSQITEALKQLIITMIACAFILCVNIAIVRALFNWSSSTFVVAAGGVAVSNVPTVSNSDINFGQHSILWVSALLTFFLMQNIFTMTRKKLDDYTSGTKRDLYNNVTEDAKTYWEKIKNTPEVIRNIWDTRNKLKK